MNEHKENNLYSYWSVGFGHSVIFPLVFLMLVNSCLCRAINIKIRITLHHKGLKFCQTLEFDISSNYRGKASVQCFIGVSNHTHLTKFAYPDWLVNS